MKMRRMWQIVAMIALMHSLFPPRVYEQLNRGSGCAGRALILRPTFYQADWVAPDRWNPARFDAGSYWCELMALLSIAAIIQLQSASRKKDSE